MSSFRKAKTSPKMFISDNDQIKSVVLKTMKKISDIVGATAGPGGKNVLIESDFAGLGHANTKDGVTVFKSLGSPNSFEHLIIEQARSAAQKTATEAGDGPQPLWSKILTPNGFVEMKEAKVGMEICGTDGTVQKIVGVYPKGLKEIYKVSFSGDRVVECCEDHLWGVLSKQKYDVKTTKQMSLDFKEKSSDGSAFYKYSTPKTVIKYRNEEQELSSKQVLNIQPTGQFTEMQCIKVSNPDSLYITDNFIVTHNTTTATILAAALVENLYDFCKRFPRYSPQKAAREVDKAVREILVPKIRSQGIEINLDNQELLKMVAKISANGDEDMAEAVIKAFELVGYGESSHVTIKQLSGPYGYDVELIEGFPIPIGYEESIGRLHSNFINDQGNQRCVLEKPLFILFDGHVNELVNFMRLLNTLGSAYIDGNSDFKNVVIVAHGFSDKVITELSINMANPTTMNVVPMVTPMAQFMNSQLEFLMDLSAFTGAKIFGLKDSVSKATVEDLGENVELFECYRFRTTVVANPDPLNIEVRASDLRKQKENAPSQAEEMWIEERLGKITNGIAKLTIYGGSGGELKEKHDRCEDAVCAVRSAISKGALPGGCRVLINLAVDLINDPKASNAVKEILGQALFVPIERLLDNAGRHGEEIQEILTKLIENRDIVYDIENDVYGSAMELGLFDCLPAVEEALKNASSIATVMGTLGGIVAYPRDNEFERAEAKADSEFKRAVENPELIPDDVAEAMGG